MFSWFKKCSSKYLISCWIRFSFSGCTESCSTIQSMYSYILLLSFQGCFCDKSIFMIDGSCSDDPKDVIVFFTYNSTVVRKSSSLWNRWNRFLMISRKKRGHKHILNQCVFSANSLQLLSIVLFLLWCFLDELWYTFSFSQVQREHQCAGCPFSCGTLLTFLYFILKTTCFSYHIIAHP